MAESCECNCLGDLNKRVHALEAKLNDLLNRLMDDGR